MKLKTQCASCFSAAKMAIGRAFHLRKCGVVIRPPLQQRLVPPQDLVQDSESIFPEQKMISSVGVTFIGAGAGQRVPDYTQVEPERCMAGVGVTQKARFGNKGAPDNANAIRNREVAVVSNHISNRGAVSRFSDGFHPQMERHSLLGCKSDLSRPQTIGEWWDEQDEW
jgi:hypothetical protein